MSGLFTVLIAEKEHIDAIRQENKLFFEPFLESKDLAFCYWDPKGQSLQDSVPGLLDAVGRRKQWRAVVINSTTPETIKIRNPFDIVDCHELSDLHIPTNQPEFAESWEKWLTEWQAYYAALADAKENVFRRAMHNPLTKLATWLCFRPEDYILNDVQSKQDVHDWAMEMIGRDDAKPSVHLEMMERDQYKHEMRLKERIRREFTTAGLLNIAHPTEMHCISIRTADNGFFDPDAFWNVRQDRDYSAFADRNMYFDKMRFMVFDLLPRTHRNFRTDYIRFMASVLVFVSNVVPSSAMQARRLYMLDTDTDDTPLMTLVTSYDRKLAATAEVLDNEMEQIRGSIPGELTDKAADALFCTPKDVDVLLDESCQLEKVFADKDYGLFYDRPTNEYLKWDKDYTTSKQALAYIAKQQGRSVRRSVKQMHFNSELIDVNVSRLTPFQIDDIRDYTDAAEDEMVGSIPPDLTDTAQYTDRLAQASEEVKKTLRQRMTIKTTAVLSTIFILLYLLCFAPFLFDNNGTPKTVATAVGLSLLMVILLAVILVITLLFLRSSLVKSVVGYNRTAQSIINDIQTAMNQFSRYLSASCNVRRGHAVQNYSKKNLDVYTKSLRIRKKHMEDIRKRRAYLVEEYQEYFGDRSFCDETMSRPYEYDFDQYTEYNYPAPFLAGDFRQVEFVSNGNYVTVPSSYVTRILVRMEEIYEK